MGRKKLKLNKEITFLLLGILIGVSISMVTSFMIFSMIKSQTLIQPGVNKIVEEEVPEEYVRCEANEGCTPTCCGCINQKYSHMADTICNKTCDVRQLKVCICVNGKCVSTGQPLPPEALPS